MRHLKRFWYHIKNSFYNPAFYETAKNKRFSRGALLLAGIFSVSAFALTTALLVVALPILFFVSTPDLIDQFYPEGVELTARDNLFSTNVEEPYFIPLTGKVLEESGDVKNAVVIDTKSDLTIDQILSYESFVVITKDSIVTRKNNSEIQAYSLKEAEMENFTISESNVSGWAQKGIAIAKVVIIPAAIVGFFFLVFFMTAFHLLSLVFAALIVWSIASIKKIKLTYGQAYMTALFASVPGIIVGILFTFILPLSFLLELVIFLVVVIANLRTPVSPEPVVETPTV